MKNFIRYLLLAGLIAAVTGCGSGNDKNNCQSGQVSTVAGCGTQTCAVQGTGQPGAIVGGICQPLTGGVSGFPGATGVGGCPSNLPYLLQMQPGPMGTFAL